MSQRNQAAGDDDSVLRNVLDGSNHGNQDGEGASAASTPERGDDNLDVFSITSTLVLHQAAREGDVVQVKDLIHAGEVVNAYDETGHSPLHLAILFNKMEVLDLLMGFHENGPDWDGTLKDQRPNVGLFNLASTGTEEKKRATTQCRNVPPPAYDQLGKSSPRTGSHQEFLNLNIPNNRGETALLMAVRNKNLDATKSLLKAGAGPNIGEGQKEMPLHTAAKAGDLLSMMILKELIKCGANLTALDVHQQTPLMVACAHGNTEVVKALMEQPFPYRQNVASRIGVRIRSRADGCTALHYAARAGNTAIIDLLIRNSAELYSRDNNNSIPLFEALRNRIYHCVKPLLLPVDQNIMEVCNILRHFFELTGPRAMQKDILRGLLDYAPRFLHYNDPRHGQMTALHKCVQKGRMDLCKLLLESRAPVNLGRPNEGTALHLAVHMYCSQNKIEAENISPRVNANSAELDLYPKIIGLLLNFGADVNSTNRVGITPFHLCAVEEDEKCGKLLLYAGANPESCKQCSMRKCHVFMRRLRKGNLMPLQIQCRVKVRAQLFESLKKKKREEDMESIENAIDKLPLPHRLRDFLL